MIFVTVGTHEQQFNRLVRQIDILKEKEEIIEDVLIQTGYSTYEPKYCKSKKFIAYKDMEKNIINARIIITHGGPSSFIFPLQIGKIPIVVPRMEQYGEHVNDHQKEFVKAVHKRFGNIIPVYKMENLGEIINNYEKIIAKIPRTVNSNNEKFNRKLSKIVDCLFENKRS